MSANSRHYPVVIVTGASRSRGIGAAICRSLAEMKMDIFFTYWTPHDQALYGQEEEGYSELLSNLRAKGVRCECMEIDLADWSHRTTRRCCPSDCFFSQPRC